MRFPDEDEKASMDKFAFQSLVLQVKVANERVQAFPRELEDGNSEQRKVIVVPQCGSVGGCVL